MNFKELFEVYKGYIGRVNDWNAVAKNPNMSEEDRFNVQIKITVEECKETLLAILLDEQESTADTQMNVMDGVADIIVTGGYLAENFTTHPVNELNIDDDSEFNIDLSTTKPLENELLLCVNQLLLSIYKDEVIGHDKILSTLATAYLMYGDKVLQYTDAVLKSNESKFIQTDLEPGEIELQDMIDNLEQAAVAKYFGKEYDIHCITVEYNNKTYLVLRANGGKGKVLKPNSYKEPKEFL